MRISKPLAALLGVLTLLPVAYLCFFVTMMFGTILHQSSSRAPEPFEYFVVAHLSTMLLSVALLAFYIVHLFKNETLTGDKRTLWAIVLFMGLFIAMPVYWFLYVWRPSSNSAGEHRVDG